MTRGLEFLKTFDIKEIQAKTHISLSSLDAILNRSYDKLERVHFAGFISILEREYQIDLSDITAEYAEQNPPIGSEKRIKVNLVVNENSEKERKNGLLLILVLIVGGVLAFIFANNYLLKEQQLPRHKEVNDSQIEEAKEKIQDTAALTPFLIPSEANRSKEENGMLAVDENITEAVELNATEVSKIVDEIVPEIANESVTIIPKRKVWIGMIELPSMKKNNRITMKKISLDSSKDWLIAFGHGQVNIQRDAELLEFNNRNKIYFIYEKGKLKQIGKTEFKRHNQGRTW